MSRRGAIVAIAEQRVPQHFGSARTCGSSSTSFPSSAASPCVAKETMPTSPSRARFAMVSLARLPCVNARHPGDRTEAASSRPARASARRYRFALSATANRTSASSSGGSNRMSPVLIGGRFDNAAQSRNSPARVFCRGALRCRQRQPLVVTSPHCSVTLRDGLRDRRDGRLAELVGENHDATRR